tara:strand:+ start:2803 stop:3393 length:591 start_codon:yes stop_codon:yes gene_type:complete
MAKEKKKKQTNKKEKSKEKKDESLEEVIEPESEGQEFSPIQEQTSSRPINLTLSSETSQQTQSWKQVPTENLEESIKDAPTKPEEEKPDEIYKSNVVQDQKTYDFETGKETKEQGRERIQTQGVSSAGIIESPAVKSPATTRNVGMMRSAEMQQAPIEESGEQNRIYSTRLSPEQERSKKRGPFGESAEETIRKYK